MITTSWICSLVGGEIEKGETPEKGRKDGKWREVERDRKEREKREREKRARKERGKRERE